MTNQQNQKPGQQSQNPGQQGGGQKPGQQQQDPQRQGDKPGQQQGGQPVRTTSRFGNQIWEPRSQERRPRRKAGPFSVLGAPPAGRLR